MAAPGSDEALLAAAGGLSAGLVAEGALRRFSLGLDLRRFEAGPRLPLNLASVVLELELPQELAALIQQSNGRLPPRLAPLRTQAVAVARGSAAALPGGQASCEFSAGLMAVAALLAGGAVMTANVYHREALADDLLLGRAHVPLAPLLQESWVDGRAGVYALVPSAADPAQHERVQIGTLHLVMSLEEAGPADAPAAAPAPAGTAAEAGLPGLADGVQPMPAAVDAAAAAPRSRPASAAGAERQELVTQPQPPQPPPAAAPHLAPAAAALGPAGDNTPGSLVAGPEFEAAWELELWKKEEEARWRRELKEREARRMAALEEAWRRREAEREAEAAALRSEFATLDAKARRVLAAAEERERKVVAAEEAVARRRRELERQHAGQVAEAEAAVRRLQAECQHQLELEAQRREGLAAAAAAEEQRAAAAEAKAAGAERALARHREQHDASEAGRLAAELAAAQAALAAAEQRAAKAAEAKRKYKQQVVRLAQEVALLQGQLAEVVGVKRAQLDAELAKLQAGEQVLAARRDAAEMSALKQQLHSLQLAGSTTGGKENCGTAGAGAGGAAGAAGAAAPVPAPAGAPCHHAQAPGGVVLQGQLCQAVQRLLHEREVLLSSGAYTPDDALVQRLDQRIKECAALAAPN